MNDPTGQNSDFQNPYAPPIDSAGPTGLPPAPGFIRRTVFMLALPWLSFLGLVIFSLIWEIDSDYIAVGVIAAVTLPSLFVALFLPVRLGAKIVLGIAYATFIWVAFFLLFGE